MNRIPAFNSLTVTIPQRTQSTPPKKESPISPKTEEFISISEDIRESRHLTRKSKKECEREMNRLLIDRVVYDEMKNLR